MLKNENQERELEQRYGIRPRFVPTATTLVDVVLRPRLRRFRSVVAVHDGGGLRPPRGPPCTAARSPVPAAAGILRVPWLALCRRRLLRLQRPAASRPRSRQRPPWLGTHVARAAGGPSLRPLRRSRLPRTCASMRLHGSGCTRLWGLAPPAPRQASPCASGLVPMTARPCCSAPGGQRPRAGNGRQLPRRPRLAASVPPWPVARRGTHVGGAGGRPTARTEERP